MRSALHRLEQEGLVASNGRERRLYVAPLTLADGQEVYFIVGHLEGIGRSGPGSGRNPRRHVLAVADAAHLGEPEAALDHVRRGR